MFNKLFTSNTSKSGSSASSAAKLTNPRDQALERARIEREQREIIRQKSGYQKILYRFLQSSKERVQTLRSIMNDIEAKLNTINTLKLALSSKGVQNFVPPATALQSLIIRYNLCTDRIMIPLHGFYCQSKIDSGPRGNCSDSTTSMNNSAVTLSTSYGCILTQLFRWINTSILSTTATNITTSIVSLPLFYPFLHKLMISASQFLLYRHSMPVNDRYDLLDQLCTLTGMNNSTVTNSSSSSSSSSTVVLDVQSRLRSHLWYALHFTDQLCRPLLYYAREYEENEYTLSSKSVSMEVDIASKAVALAFYLADTLSHGSSTTTSGTSPFTFIVQHLLTVPWLYTRIQNSKHYQQCRAVEYLPNLLDSLVNLLRKNNNNDLYSVEQNLPPARYVRKAKPLVNSTITNNTSMTSGSSTVSVPNHSNNSTSSSTVASPSSSSGPLHGWSTYAVPEKGKSFFDSDLAKLSLNPVHSSTNSNVSSSSSSSSSSFSNPSNTNNPLSLPYAVYLPYGIVAWKPETFVLGNVLSLFIDPLPNSTNTLSVTAIDASYVPHLLDTLAILIEALPDTVWNTSRPVLYVTPSDTKTSSGSTVPVPVTMPLPLIVQLRKLSNEPFSRYVAKICTRMMKEKLSHSRLRLPVSEDPERTTYDSTSMDPRLGLGYTMNSSNNSSTLEATPSLTTAVLRSVWETSKLALSLFQRNGGKKSSHHEQKTTKSSIDDSIRTLTLNSSSVGTPTVSSSSSGTPFDNKAVYAFTRVYANLCAPRPVRSSAASSTPLHPLPPVIDNDPIINRTYLLSALAFTTDVTLLTNLWYFCVDQIDLSNFVKTLAFKSTATNQGVFGVLTLLASLLAHVCLVIDDIELYDASSSSSFLPLRELRYAIRFLRDIIVHAEGIGVDTFTYPPAKEALTTSPVPFWYRFSTAAVSALRSLYDRHTLRPLGPPDLFLIDVTKIQICLLLPNENSGTTDSPASSSSSNVNNRTTTVHPLSTSSVSTGYRTSSSVRSSSATGGIRRVGTGTRSQRNRGLFGWNPFSGSNGNDDNDEEINGDDGLDYDDHDSSAATPASTATPSETEIAIDRLLLVAPFTVPFSKRAERFEQRRARAWYQCQVGQPQVRVKVSRNRIFESTYLSLRHLTGNDLHRKIAVIFYDTYGNPEMGLDAGGLFKELWTNLCSIIFNPNYGLWALTTNEHEFYPNPQAGLLLDSVTAAILADNGDGSSSSSSSSTVTEEMVYEFIGKIVGKALWEGITIGPQFARFFLHRFTGRGIQLHHLASLDYELYKSLMFLKTYEGDVSDLCLTFTMNIESIFDDTSSTSAPQEKELIPNGRNITVTNSNRLQYIYLVADARLNQAIAKQTNAFLDGLHSVIPAVWLNTFSPPELQVLISGSLGEIDIDDLRECTVYANGYTANDSFIVSFWSTVNSFSASEKAAFLKFVTSCERAPSLGFKHLHPKFTVERVNVPKNERGENAPLPTASTCFHVLRLPTYNNAKILREKLLLAITSGGGGFHLI